MVSLDLPSLKTHSTKNLLLVISFVTQPTYPAILSKMKLLVILEFRIFSNRPRYCFILGGNFHAGKGFHPLSNQQVPVDRRRAIMNRTGCSNGARHIPVH